MATQPVPAYYAEVEMPIITAFQALNTRQQLRLFNQLADQFSFSRGHDQIHGAIETIAFDAAEDEGYRGDDLAARYLADPWPAFDLAPTVMLPALSVVA